MTRYALFTVIYYLAEGRDSDGNRYIYDVIDWSEPGRTFGVVVGCLVGLCVVYLVVYGLYKLRVFIYNRYFDHSGTPKSSMSGSSNRAYQVME